VLAPGKASKPAPVATPAPAAAPALEAEKPTGSLPPVANLATKAAKLQTERAPAEPPKARVVVPKVMAPTAIAPEKDRARIAALRSEAEPPAVDAKEKSWSLGEPLMFGLAALAVLALVLAMRLQRRDLEQRQLRAAGMKADLRARLGRTEARDAPRHAADALPPGSATARAVPTVFGTLRAYVSAALFLTIAVSIYLGSQNPATIKHFIAHLSHARVIATP
jgi:hypothetical protein